MKATKQFGTLLGIAALLCSAVFVPDVSAQARRKPAQRPQNQRNAPPPQQRNNVQPRPNQPGLRPDRGEPTFMDRLRQMPPRQQERLLRNNPRFQSLPPAEQARIRENLRRWNDMSPQQQRDFLDRQTKWQQMTPEQRQYVRRELMPRWQQLEPERRQAIMRRMGALRDLSEEERAAKLKDEAFLSGLNDDDRELLRELSKLRLPPPEPHEPPESPLP